MDVLESLEKLVDEVLDVLIRQLVLRVDDLVQIRLHEIQNHVYTHTQGDENKRQEEKQQT